jgi:hypothetical protein
VIDSRLEGRLTQLALRRQLLTRRAAATRQIAAGAIETLAPAAARVDRALSAVRYLQQHPLLTAVAMAVATRLWRYRGGAIGAVAAIAWQLARHRLR